MNNVGSLSEMVNSSIVVLTKPSVSTFEMYERRGNLQNALIYVAIAALVAGVIGLVGGISGLIAGVLSTLVGFIVFTYAVFFIGRAQGGTGTYDEVAYTFSLFYVPLSIVGSILGLIPCLGALAGLIIIVAYIYFGYLAVQSSMNLRDTGKAIITLVAAGLINLVISIIIASVLVGGSLLAGAATS